MTHVEHLRSRLGLQDLVSDEEIKDLPYLTLEEGSEEYKYLHARREALQGYTPKRIAKFSEKLTLPEVDAFKPLLEEQKRDISTTMACTCT